MNPTIQALNLPLNADEILDALNDKELFELKDELMKISVDFFTESEKENMPADIVKSKDMSGDEFERAWKNSITGDELMQRLKPRIKNLFDK